MNTFATFTNWTTDPDFLSPNTRSCYDSFDKFALQSTKSTSSYSFDCFGQWQASTCRLAGLASLSINVFHELDA